MLTEVALTDLGIFIGILDVNYNSPLLENPVQSSDEKEHSHKLIERLARYAEAYSKISRHYFPNLCSKIEPYTKKPVGIWVSEGSVMYQFRSTTPQYPQEVVMLPPEIAGDFFGGFVHPQVKHDLGNPAGMIQIGMPDLTVQLPQKVAWKRLIKQLSKLFEKGTLNEFMAPGIMQERIRELLFDKPDMLFGNTNKRERNYQKLGFRTKESVYEVSINELYQRTNHPLIKHTQQFHKLSAEDPTLTIRSPEKRWHND